jgi:hypothetical protein
LQEFPEVGLFEHPEASHESTVQGLPSSQLEAVHTGTGTRISFESPDSPAEL